MDRYGGKWDHSHIRHKAPSVTKRLSHLEGEFGGAVAMVPRGHGGEVEGWVLVTAVHGMFLWVGQVAMHVGVYSHPIDIRLGQGGRISWWGSELPCTVPIVLPNLLWSKVLLVAVEPQRANISLGMAGGKQSGLVAQTCSEALMGEEGSYLGLSGQYLLAKTSTALASLVMSSCRAQSQRIEDCVSPL
jgi:hypothetical protein